MNFLDAVGVFEASATTLIRDTSAAKARQIIQETLDAYDALEPTPEMWAAAPETTQWYTLDANGRYSAYESEPHWTPNEPDEWEYTQRWIGQHIDIPLGVDWRLCKWQRPSLAPVAVTAGNPPSDKANLSVEIF